MATTPEIQIHAPPTDQPQNGNGKGQQQQQRVMNHRRNWTKRQNYNPNNFAAVPGSPEDFGETNFLSTPQKGSKGERQSNRSGKKGNNSEGQSRKGQSTEDEQQTGQARKVSPPPSPSPCTYALNLPPKTPPRRPKWDEMGQESPLRLSNTPLGAWGDTTPPRWIDFSPPITPTPNAKKYGKKQTPVRFQTTTRTPPRQQQSTLAKAEQIHDPYHRIATPPSRKAAGRRGSTPNRTPTRTRVMAHQQGDMGTSTHQQGNNGPAMQLFQQQTMSQQQMQQQQQQQQQLQQSPPMVPLALSPTMGALHFSASPMGGMTMSSLSSQSPGLTSSPTSIASLSPGGPMAALSPTQIGMPQVLHYLPSGPSQLPSQGDDNLPPSLAQTLVPQYAGVLVPQPILQSPMGACIQYVYPFYSPMGNTYAALSVDQQQQIAFQFAQAHPMQLGAPMAAAQITQAGQTPTSSFVAFPSAQPTQLPLNLANANTKIFCIAEFKRERRLQYQSKIPLQVGDYVIVEGDEGEDLGRIIQSWVGASNDPPLINNNLGSNRNSGATNNVDSSGTPVYPEVIRHATSSEVQAMQTSQQSAEAKCLEVAKAKTKEHQLPMSVVDAEFQFDRKKLTFYYEAAERVDFRELVRDLYRSYRARIWMCKVPQNENEPTPTSSRKRGQERFNKGRDQMDEKSN
jgi:hypothetical protein